MADTGRKIKLDQKVGVDLIELLFIIEEVDTKKFKYRYSQDNVGTHNNINLGKRKERIIDVFIGKSAVKQIKIEITPYQIVKVYTRSGRVCGKMIIKVQPQYASMGNINNHSWNEVLRSVTEVRNVLDNEWGIRIKSDIYISSIEINKTFVLAHPVAKLVQVWDEHVKFYSSFQKKSTFEDGCGSDMRKTGIIYQNESIHMKVYDKLVETNINNQCDISTDVNLVRLEFKILKKGISKMKLNGEIHTINDQLIEHVYNILVQKHINETINLRDTTSRKRLEEIILQGSIKDNEHKRDLVTKLTECNGSRPRALMCISELDTQMIKLNNDFSKNVKRNLASIVKELDNAGWTPRMAKSQTCDVLNEFVEKATSHLEEVEIEVIDNKHNLS